LRGYENYLADERGNVITIATKRVMKGKTNRGGYKQCTLTKDGRSQTKEIHRLILLSFDPIPNHEEMYTNHKNGIKTDNRISNLEWVSRSENTKHSYKTGLQKNVTNQHGSFKVLSKSDKRKIKNLHLSGLVDRAIAAKVGCSRELVGRKIREMGLR